jgi:hypothetical protein
MIFTLPVLVHRAISSVPYCTNVLGVYLDSLAFVAVLYCT